jgi:predicted nucleic acid-binding protein
LILIDTSVWIEFLRTSGTPGATALYALITDEADICLADVNLTEILRGIADQKSYERVKQDLLRFPILASRGVETCIKAADIYRECRRQGRTVRNSQDCLIAAIAIENNVSVLHNDADFEHIASVVPKLRLSRPENFLT